jgi:hypothetical protein
MPRHKVRLADNIARVIFIETDATIGATLGTDVRTPDGVVGTPATVRAWLGVNATGAIDTGSGGAVTQQNHKLLLGLTTGNDHPQYTRRDTLTTEGDIYVRNATTVARLGVGTEQQALVVEYGIPTWADVVHTVVPGTGIAVDDSNPYHPVVSLDASSVQGAIQFQNEGYDLGAPGDVHTIDFVGAGVDVDLYGGVLTVNISGGGGGGDLDFEDEGTPVVTASTVNFVGAGVTVTDVSGVATVTIPGGGGGDFPPDPNEFSIFYETDFVNSTFGPVSTSPGNLGFDSFTGGGGSLTSVADVVNHPGIYRLNNSTGTGGVAIIGLAPDIFASATTQGVVIPAAADGMLVLDAILRVSDVLRSDASFWLWGFHSDADGGTVNSVFVISKSDGTLVLRCANGTANDIALSSTPADATWFRLRLELTATECRAYLDDALVATNTSNIPTGPIWPIAHANSGGVASAARQLDIDWFRYSYTFLTARV